MSSELYDFAADMRHETELAWLVHNGEKEVWVPKSLGEWEPARGKPGHGTMTVPEWWAYQEDLL